MILQHDHDTMSHYPPPRGNVLLLTCMDLRLLDDVVRFMNRDNLVNRYDQFILAGCSLGPELKPEWEAIFFEHLKAAVELHAIKDVYIIEHRHCGAYELFLGKEGTFSDSREDQAREMEIHRDYASRLAEKIVVWSLKRKNPLAVRCFLMDLRGNVQVISDPDEEKIAAQLARKRRKAVQRGSTTPRTTPGTAPRG